MTRHIINDKFYYPYGDIEKKYHITKEQLDQTVAERLVRTETIHVYGTGHVFTVYNEADVLFCKANKKFKSSVKGWFDELVK